MNVRLTRGSKLGLELEHDSEYDKTSPLEEFCSE